MSFDPQGYATTAAAIDLKAIHAAFVKLKAEGDAIDKRLLFALRQHIARARINPVEFAGKLGISFESLWGMLHQGWPVTAQLWDCVRRYFGPLIRGER